MYTAKDVSIMVKIQIVQTEEEKHSLSQDLARIMSKTSDEYVDTLVFGGPDPKVEDDNKDNKNNEELQNSTNQENILKVSSLLIKARSPMLAVMLLPNRDEAKKVKFRRDFHITIQKS